MASTARSKAMLLVPLALLLFGVGALAMKRVEDQAQKEASLKSEKPLPLSVRCIRAISGPIQALVFGEGTARAVRREFLTFEHQGKITYVKLNEDGQTVRAGDRVQGPKEGENLGEILASLDKREHLEQLKVTGSNLVESEQQVNIARSQVGEAKAQLQLAEDHLKRHEKLYQVKAISKYELEVARTRTKTARAAVTSAKARLGAAQSGVKASQARMKQARLPMERTSIYAPFDGILTFVNINKGDYFAPNLINSSSEEALLKTIPMVVIDPTQFEVTMELPYFEGAMVRPGQSAIIITSADMIPSPEDLQPGKPLKQGAMRGTVFSVSPAISPGGRAIQIKVRTEKGPQNIRDGMFVTCWIVVLEKADAVVVPYDVFVYRKNKPYVFVVNQTEGRVEQRQVVEGIAGLSTEEILEGVQAGELLVNDGRHRLSNGAPVTVIEIIGESQK
ncbi:MAG: hypothetical protein GY846_10145 [Deltaproteobacteria bacterium]|nr:hypothetical protein [Deltaproteobacteria bacterium]